MMVPVLGGPEEGAVSWIEMDVDAAETDTRPTITESPDGSFRRQVNRIIEGGRNAAQMIASVLAAATPA